MSRYSAFLILSLLAFGCKTPTSTTSSKIIEQGVASWYGPNFHDKKTANGERYDMYDLTAAHRTLPFNSEVEVLNLDNGKRVKVRINDRGPFAKNRIIDLSKKAATAIDMIGPGTANVQLSMTRSSGRALPVDLKQQSFTVQIASFQSRESAASKKREIPDAWIQQVKVDNKTVYRVCYGKYSSKEEASGAQLELSQKGIKGFVKQVEN